MSLKQSKYVGLTRQSLNGRLDTIASKFSFETLAHFTHTFEETGCALATEKRQSCIYYWTNALCDLEMAKSRPSCSTPILPLSGEQRQHMNALAQQSFRPRLWKALYLSDTSNWNWALQRCYDVGDFRVQPPCQSYYRRSCCYCTVMLGFAVAGLWAAKTQFWIICRG